MTSHALSRIVKLATYLSLHILGLTTAWGFFQITIASTLNPLTIVSILILSIIFSFISLNIYKIHPEKFQLTTSKIFRRSILLFWIDSPFSNFTLSLALIAILFGLMGLIPPSSLETHITQGYQLASENVYGPILLLPIYLSLFIIPAYLIMKLIGQKSQFQMIIVVLLYSGVMMFYLWFFLRFSSWLDLKINYLLPIITKFIIGSLPIGWTYELFISSIAPRSSNIIDNLRN